jgi:hypothetical protein
MGTGCELLFDTSVMVYRGRDGDGDADLKGFEEYQYFYGLKIAFDARIVDRLDVTHEALMR